MPRKARYGFTRTQHGIYIPLPAGTTAAEIVTDWVAGYEFLVEKVRAFVAIAGTGAGATRTLRVLKGASTVVATATVTLASTDTLGEEQTFTVTDDDATNLFTDTDVLTVDFPNGGTAFTAGALNLLLTLRTEPQARR